MARGDATRSQAISVFVRVRPLTPAEREQRATELQSLQLVSSDPTVTSATVLDDGRTQIAGFTGVLGQEALNRDVFERTFAPRLQTVLRGGTASLFCYGYTGSGKTHTVIGYGAERGLFFLAAEHLLRELEGVNTSGLFLRASACELYNDQVFDLLGPSKLSCTLRVDEGGQLQVLGPQESVPLSQDPTECGSIDDLLAAEVLAELGRHLPAANLHATLVTRSAGLRSASILRPEDLHGISQTCVQQRAVGASTEHVQSSRSHALLRMCVANDAVVKAQEELEAAEAEIPARKNAMDNIRTRSFYALYDLHCHTEVLRLPDAAEGNAVYIVQAKRADDHSSHPLCQLKGYEQEGFKSVGDWAQHFGVPELRLAHEFKKREFTTPGMWDTLKAAIDERTALVKQLLEETEAKVEMKRKALEAVYQQGPKSLGGTLLFVDLAGADYDHRSGSQQKESAAINKSLLSLKECFRSLAQVSTTKPKFRDSKLTRLLEDSLAPSSSSTRHNRESVSVMLVNISPAEYLLKKTLNTLRYGQMFATSSGSTKEAAAPVRGQPAASLPAAGAPPAKSDPAIRMEVRSLYRQFCPEKSDREVETILCRFAGREEELLAKARAKYGGS